LPQQGALLNAVLQIFGQNKYKDQLFKNYNKKGITLSI
jgi:hypothetical protein